MIETDLMRSAPVGPGRDFKSDFGLAGLALGHEQPRGLGELGDLPRLVAHEVFRRHAREQERREAFRHVAAQAFQDRAGLLDQPARLVLLVAAELPLDVHGLLPGELDSPRFRGVSPIHIAPSSDTLERRRIIRDFIRAPEAVRWCGRLVARE